MLTDARIKSGWGIDYVLPQRVLPATHGYRVAVVDAVPMVHTKPLSVVDSAALASSFYTRFRINPEAELRYFLRAYKARKQPPRVLREVPAPVDYRRRSRRLPPAVDSCHTRKSARASRGPVAFGCGIRLPAYLQSNLDREMRPWEAADTAGKVARFDPATLPQYYNKVPLGFHARIRDNALTVVKDLGSFQSRNQSTVQMLHDVLAMYHVPDCEFLVCTDDKPAPPDVPTVPLFVMAKRASQRYLTYPDHTFYDWPEAQTGPWDVERHALRKADDTRTTKTPAAMFRGNATTAYVRQHLADASPHHPELDVEDVRVGAGVGTVVTAARAHSMELPAPYSRHQLRRPAQVPVTHAVRRAARYASGPSTSTASSGTTTSTSTRRRASSWPASKLVPPCDWQATQAPAFDRQVGRPCEPAHRARHRTNRADARSRHRSLRAPRRPTRRGGASSGTRRCWGTGRRCCGGMGGGGGKNAARRTTHALLTTF